MLIVDINTILSLNYGLCESSLIFLKNFAYILIHKKRLPLSLLYNSCMLSLAIPTQIRKSYVVRIYHAAEVLDRF